MKSVLVLTLDDIITLIMCGILGLMILAAIGCVVTDKIKKWWRSKR